MTICKGEFEGKVALITGAARGMGFAIAERLGAAGALVALNDLTAPAVEAAAKSLRHEGIEALPLPGSVAEAVNVRGMIASIRQRFGRLDILINNAGVLRSTRAEQISDDEWNLLIDVNLKGTFLCCRESIPDLRNAPNGRIVNMSSTAGKSVSTAGGAHYTAAKAGVLGLTRHLARELAHHRITVNAVCPGLIDTEMVRQAISAVRIQQYAAAFPIPRLGRPDEVAELIAFLVSERASYITGASLDINGGDLTI